MRTLTDLFFSPVGREYCNWFYFLTLSSFVFMVMAGFCTLSLVLKKKLEPMEGLIIFISPFLSYFTNRLLYSMCAGSLGYKTVTHASPPPPPKDFGGYKNYV